MNKFHTKILKFSVIPLLLVLILGCQKSETIRVTYFFASQCNDCEEAGEILKRIKTKIMPEGRPVHLEIELHNILGEEGWDVLMDTLERTNVPATAQHMPLLFIGDQWYYGEEEIGGAVDALRTGTLPQGVLFGNEKQKKLN